jgi:hypothetical protein
MFEELEAAQRAISDLSKEQSTEQLLEPTPEDERLLAQLVRNKEEQEYLRYAVRTDREQVEAADRDRCGTSRCSDVEDANCEALQRIPISFL